MWHLQMRMEGNVASFIPSMGLCSFGSKLLVMFLFIGALYAALVLCWLVYLVGQLTISLLFTNEHLCSRQAGHQQLFSKPDDTHCESCTVDFQVFALKLTTTHVFCQVKLLWLHTLIKVLLLVCEKSFPVLLSSLERVHRRGFCLWRTECCLRHVPCLAQSGYSSTSSYRRDARFCEHADTL